MKWYSIKRWSAPVDVYCIIKGFYIFKNETVGMSVVLDSEAVQPFSFDKRMKCLLDTGISYGYPVCE